MGLSLSTLIAAGAAAGQTVTRTSIATGDSPYTALSTDYLIGCDTSGGTITINLPAAATAGAGTVYIVKDETGDAGVSSVTISPNGTETIDEGSSFFVDVGHDSVTFYTDGSNWFII